MVRQKPGETNSLGLVKIIFPSPDNVYLHGTDAPRLFSQDVREFSHLRTRNPHTGGVAQHSLHMQAEAIDICLRGIPTSEVGDAALRLHRGGVGYYRSSDFVHVEVGRVRRW